MMQILNVTLVLLTLILYSVGARPLDGDSQTALPAAKDLLVFIPVPDKEKESKGSSSHFLAYLAATIQDDPTRLDYGFDDPNSLPLLDPNFVLLLQHFQPGEWAGPAPRLTRADASPASSHHANRGYLDVMYVPRRRSDLPYALLPPPVQHSAAATPANKVGRSINTADLNPNQPDVTSDDENPDFLSALVTVPQVWMHDLSQIIIQPLRKNPAGERDSYEYFGMVGKAPYITCPLGFKKNTLGTCRPVFRSKRDSKSTSPSSAPEGGLID